MNSCGDTHRVLKRRAVMGLIGAGAANAVSDKQKVWIRPVVESVLLPAHAATSNVPETTTTLPPNFEITILSNFGCGQRIPFSGNVMATMTVSPPSSAGESLSVSIDCGGSAVNLSLPLDVAGTTSITLSAEAFCGTIAPVPEPAPPNIANLSLSASYQSVAATCSWVFEGEVLANNTP